MCGFGFDNQDGNAVNKKNNIRTNGFHTVAEHKFVCYVKSVVVDILGIDESYVAFLVFRRAQKRF